MSAVFWALFLSREEKKAVLHYVSQAATATITVIRVYVEERFQQYELMASTLGPLHRHKDQKNSRGNNAEILSGAAATAGFGAGGANERGGGGGRGRGRGRRWPDSERSGKDNADGRPPATKKHTCEFCVAKTNPSTGHAISACPWISSASKSDLLTTLPNLCLGCFQLKSAGTHKCPNWMSDGQSRMKFFCTTCKVNKKLCKAPKLHTPSPIPATFSGHVSGQALHEEEGQAAL